MTASDLSTLRDNLSDLEAGRSISIKFEPTECYLRFAIKVTNRGALDINGELWQVPTIGTHLKFAISDVERAQLSSLLRSLTEICKAFPVR